MNDDDSDDDEDDCDYDGDCDKKMMMMEEKNARCYYNDDRTSWFLFLISMYSSLSSRNTEPCFQFFYA